MSVVVISNSPAVVVQASEPVTATTGDIKLSTSDKFFLSFAGRLCLVFEHPMQEPVEKIRSGLSRALVHYYPMAGRLAAGATAGEVVIRCTGEGVSLVAASASCALEDVQDRGNPSLKEKLAAAYPAADGSCRYSDPFLLMQVTVFSCGGFVLGVTWNHAVADGVGMAQFLQAVGELSRGLPSPSVVPVRQEDSVVSGPPPAFTKFLEFVGGLQPSQMALLEITVKPGLVNRVKEQYASMNPAGQSCCSVFDVVAAVLWRCRSRVTISDPEALTVLSFSTNARKHAGAKEGFYGNCLCVQLVTATAGTVSNGDFMDLVKMIHAAKEGGMVPEQSDVDEMARHVTDPLNLVGITSWRNIGLESADFGAGRPERVMSFCRRMSLPLCVVCMPCKDEYSVVSVCVKEDRAAAFLHELAHMHTTFMPS